MRRGSGFCPFVDEVFYLEIATGSTPTTYSPGQRVLFTGQCDFIS